MATITKDYAKRQRQPGGAPYGNMSALHFSMKTNASGVLVDSDGAAAVAIGDKIRVGVLPAGMLLLDYILTISDAFTTDSTFKVGFEYVDGEDSTSVPQDDDFFCAATTAATAAVLKKTNTVAPVTLPKDAWLLVTNAGAAQAAVGVADIVVLGVLTGTP